MRNFSLLDAVESVCRTWTDKAAFVIQRSDGTGTRSLSFAEAWHCIERHRLWLKERVLEAKPNLTTNGDVAVVYIAGNSIDLLLSMLASTRLQISHDRCVTALLNVRWAPAEMAHALCSQNPQNSTTIIVFGKGFEDVASQVIGGLGHGAVAFPLPLLSMDESTCSVLTSFPNFSQNKHADSDNFSIDYVEKFGSDQDAMIIFTSGTTGGSKGVRLSHRAIVIQSLAKLADPCNYSCETLMLASTVPFFHVGGISSSLAVVFSGGTLVFPWDTDSKFDACMVKAQLDAPTYAVNTLVVVPAMLVALLCETDSIASYPNVRLVLIGGQSASRSLITHLSHLFPNARLVQTYACTEAASSLTFLHVNSKKVAFPKPTARADAPQGDLVGTPPPHVHLRLYQRQGNTTKVITLPYQPGIIATRGPHLMNGYWARGSLTAPGNLEGWYLTSDLGFCDEHGQLYFCGRVKDVIRTGGETVIAREVERVLLQHPAITECAVFARQDDRFGEAVACAIVTNQPNIQFSNIKKWCQEQGLASYKRPRYFFLVESLPRNSSGKLLKHQLVAKYGRIQSKL